ncbi:MAG: helix-turn-helix domain-containing protein [Candidatus Pararuminococcus gallinarum]
MIVYTPLWKTMKEKNVTTYTLISKFGMSSHTVHRLRHNMGISTQLINDLCRILDCRVEDILLYQPDIDEKTTAFTD